MPNSQNQMFQPYDPQMAEFERRRKLLEILKARALTPTDNPPPGRSGPYEYATLKSPLESIAQVYSAYAAKKRGEKLNEEENQLGLERNNQFADAMQAFDQKAAQDPQGARQVLYEALRSTNPQLQAFARAKLQQEPQGLNLKSFSPGSVVIDQNTGKVFQPQGGGGQGGQDPYEIIEIGGDKYQKTSMGLKKLDDAPKTTTNVSLSANPVIAGQKAGMQQYWKDAAAQVSELGKEAKSAVELKRAVDRLKALDSQGIYSNITSGPTTFLANLGQSVGMDIDPNKLANTETYNAITTELWQQLVSKFGGNRGVTEAEAKKIETMLPQSIKSPEARQQLFAVLEEITGKKIAEYKVSNKAFAEAVEQDSPSTFYKQMETIFNPGVPHQVEKPATQADPTTGVKPGEIKIKW